MPVACRINNKNVGAVEEERDRKREIYSKSIEFLSRVHLLNLLK